MARLSAFAKKEEESFLDMKGLLVCPTVLLDLIFCFVLFKCYFFTKAPMIPSRAHNHHYLYLLEIVPVHFVKIEETVVLNFAEPKLLPDIERVW